MKAGDTFALFDPFGDAQASAEGIFHNDTRHLARLGLLIEGHRPLILSSRITEDNAAFIVDLTNPDLFDGSRLRLSRDAIHIRRTKVLSSGACLECIGVQNYENRPVELGITMHVATDFADIFEVRGTRRHRRGRLLEPRPTSHGLVLGYLGLDDVVRRTRIVCDPLPAIRSDGVITWRLRLAPGATETLHVGIHCETGLQAAERDVTFLEAVRERRRWLRGRRRGFARIHASNEGFNDWLNRSRADLEMLITQTPDGPIAYAGIPWYSTTFGRDALITALQTLWVDPDLARGTLAHLARSQAVDLDPERDAEPGKILHETRRGEMARLHEVPFARYYGTVDATPLFVMLAAAYHQRTGDGAFVRRLWPNIRAALDWMERYGDLDGDGFIEYGRRSPDGLINQCWKDSANSIFHADGSLAEGPIASCEVQAYAYAAWLGASVLARTLQLDETGAIERWERHATTLREQFDEAFWCEELGTYALALDGDKRPCRIRASNAGHALFAGIARPERVPRLIETLMSRRSFCGWGIRTVAEDEPLYNPMSYHNGSVWPHDNSLIAVGFARYGFQGDAAKVMTGLFDAALSMELRRLPELFCGFARRRGAGPTDYPVACTPQAWASGTAFAVLGACLGISFDGSARQILLRHPFLPAWLDEVRIENLRLGDGCANLLFRRHKRDVAVNVVEKEGDLEVVLVS